jgi:hypothetical protein
MNPFSGEAVTISEAVPSDAFWDVHDLLYEKQLEFSPNFFASLKKSLGISGRDLAAAKATVGADERAAEALFITMGLALTASQNGLIAVPNRDASEGRSRPGSSDIIAPADSYPIRCPERDKDECTLVRQLG